MILADFSIDHHSRIRVVETFDRSDLPRLLEGHQIVLLPTLSEGFGNGLLEGMACGLAPVSTTTPGPTEFVADMENGLLVPPANAEALKTAISTLVADPDLLFRLRVAAHTSAQAHSWHRVALEKIEVYERLLAA